MLRSLYAGVSGLKNFQTKLDVIGNNIANVNTTGYKESRVSFSDMVSQNIIGAYAPDTTNNIGGINQQQVGFGSSIGSIDTIDTQGSFQTTGRTLDLAINGDGYFQVQQGGTDASHTNYTRAGNFYLDNSGDLVTNSGAFVLDNNGQRITIQNPESIQNLNISSTGQITYDNADGTAGTPAQIGIVRFQNPEGLAKIGNNMYARTPNSDAGTITTSIPGQNGTGTLQSGSLEMSNVDLSDQFTEMIVAQRAFQANSKTITTSDQILQELINMKQ